jgi:UDP-sulfoquinovose synthase
MRILILGGDGYLGWPTAMALAAQGHSVVVADNYLRRNLARETCSEALIETPNLHKRAELFSALSGKSIDVCIGDCTKRDFLERIFKTYEPEVAVHYAEQPSAPYSMRGYDEARLTLDNNLGTTFNLIWSVLTHAPDCHIVKLGTMGEYGVPNIDIEEGWIDITHNGRTDKFLFPRQAGSLYHTTKVMDTDLLWFYVRTYGLRVTDLMQGPVYGLSTDEVDLSEALLPSFHYDDIFGTVVNRFVVQAVAGVPLTVYGQGGQIRGYLNLRDTLQCVRLAAENPAGKGELRVFNQFTEQFSVLQLAEIVSRAGRGCGLKVEIRSIQNPRKEKESHYYNAAHTGLLALGLQPTYLTDEVAGKLIERVSRHRASIDTSRIMPRVNWSTR